MSSRYSGPFAATFIQFLDLLQDDKIAEAFLNGVGVLFIELLHSGAIVVEDLSEDGAPPLLFNPKKFKQAIQEARKAMELSSKEKSK